MNNQAIGIFDSGIGGLTVVKEIIKVLPEENIIYLGDTARVPYGTRDKETITKFALELTNFLIKQKVKILVVACNTISATCLDKIQAVSPIPVIGVIEPTISEAKKITKYKRVGVIGTRATINSGVFDNKSFITQACPLFVPLVEEGSIDHPATKLIAEDYLKIFKNKKIDVLILGCTHYPLLKKVIQTTVGKKVRLIDSAGPVSRELKKILEKNNLLTGKKIPKYRFLVTDTPQRTKQIADIFFNHRFPGRLEKIIII